MEKKSLKRGLSQEEEPFLEAIKEYVASSPIPFDVPGHNMGRLETDFSDFVGREVYVADVNAPIGLDNLYHPKDVIKKTEKLIAEAFNADEALISVNGTTGGIMTMINALLCSKEKLILPRNVHKSVINAIILSGAYPIFVEPDVDENSGIANGVSVEKYVEAMDENLDAKAIFIINPTYFGIASDIKTLVEEAHKRNMLVIADEAHGSHLHFSKKLPMSAMDAGADISSCSLHKTGGSLTQTSLILINKERVDVSRVQRVFAMFSSTSPSHILLASVDAARKKMYFEGEKLLEKSLELASYAREEINKIEGLSVLDETYCNAKGRFAIDLTKLVIDVSKLGISGFDVYKEIRKRYNIQLELGEVSEVLAIIGLGTTKEDVDKLISGFKGLSKLYFNKKNTKYQVPHFSYEYPKLVVRPREAFHAPSKIVRLEDSLGEISAESIMVYPPGIPIAIPGEMITSSALELVEFYESRGGVLLSDSKEGFIKVIDQSSWYLGSEIDYDF